MSDIRETFALEVWTVTPDSWDAITHAPGEQEWSYVAPDSVGCPPGHGRDNYTLCGRKAAGRMFKTGDNGGISMEVTCKQCIRKMNKGK